MLFVIHALDKTGAVAQRELNYEAHRNHLSDAANQGIEIVMSGPLVSDDGDTAIGSLFVFEAPHRDAVKRFHQADPFFVAGIWEQTLINAFVRKR